MSVLTFAWRLITALLGMAFMGLVMLGAVVLFCCYASAAAAADRKKVKSETYPEIYWEEE
jgi:uncharacterized membrane protein